MLTTNTSNCFFLFQLCVILEPMQELMSRNKAYALSPRDCLKTTLFQKWQRIIAPPGTRGTSFTLHYRIIHFCSTCCVRVRRVVAIFVASLFTVWQVSRERETERDETAVSHCPYTYCKNENNPDKPVLPNYARIVSSSWNEQADARNLLKKKSCINLEPRWAMSKILIELFW